LLDAGAVLAIVFLALRPDDDGGSTAGGAASLPPDLGDGADALDLDLLLDFLCEPIVAGWLASAT
jgi:hypothetical protein